MSLEKQKVAIVTGANGGVGSGLCQRLLEQEGENIKIVMACRNYERANNLKILLLKKFPSAEIDIELVDLNSIESVFRFCATVTKKYGHVNYLFCNAATLSVTGINWVRSFYMLFTDIVGLVESSEATTQIPGEINPDGMGKVFATNVFGHYIIMRELEPLLSHSGEGRVIWTSSNTANYQCFQIDDWQGVKCKEPYESSKWACDLVSITTNDRFRRDKIPIYSFSTSPGVVASDIGNLAKWILWFRTILHYIMRYLGVLSQNINGYNGAVADMFVAFQSVSVLSCLYRYTSLTTRFGVNYCQGLPIQNFDPQVAKKCVDHCELRYQSLKKNLKYSNPSD